MNKCWISHESMSIMFPSHAESTESTESMLYPRFSWILYRSLSITSPADWPQTRSPHVNRRTSSAGDGTFNPEIFSPVQSYLGVGSETGQLPFICFFEDALVSLRASWNCVAESNRSDAVSTNANLHRDCKANSSPSEHSVQLRGQGRIIQRAQSLVFHKKKNKKYG